ncbi:MAG: hypothetical protein IPI42_08670 [Saprospiraceae bacterium]|nr:hypothetical protein [Candidatus Parvibacillus calidus]
MLQEKRQAVCTKSDITSQIIPEAIHSKGEVLPDPAWYNCLTGHPF